jgi:hypothetical protein
MERQPEPEDKKTEAPTWVARAKASVSVEDAGRALPTPASHRNTRRYKRK